MPVIGVQHCLRDCDARIRDSLDLSREAHDFCRRLPGGSFRSIGIRRIELFAGLALFGIYTIWENFLESVFLRYMCGARAASGFSPVLLCRPMSSIVSAMTTLLGANLRYLNWNPLDVITRASTYFGGGEPFYTTINAVTQTLSEMAAVRNCLAHRSEYALLEFRSVVLRRFGYVPRGINPGRFLLMLNPSPSAGGQRFLEFYANTILGASQSIVP